MKHSETKLHYLSARILALSLLCAFAVQTEGTCNASPVAVNDVLSLETGTTYFDPLANDSDLAGEPLTLTTVSTTCPASVAIDQGLISVGLASPLSSNCSIQYEVQNEGGHAATGTIAVTSSSLGIFTDGFELGNVSSWSCDSCFAEGPSTSSRAGR